MVSFITGNSRKAENLKLFLSPFQVCIGVKNIPNLTEIQSNDVCEVAREKGMSAYRVLKIPVIVNDGGWNIPALNGFPGAYMKDVNNWLTALDMWNMMREKEDKRVFLLDTYACISSDGVAEVFSAEMEGVFIEPTEGAKTLDDIVIFKGCNTVITALTNEDRIRMWNDNEVWREIAEWVKVNS